MTSHAPTKQRNPNQHIEELAALPRRRAMVLLLVLCRSLSSALRLLSVRVKTELRRRQQPCSTYFLTNLKTRTKNDRADRALAKNDNPNQHIDELEEAPKIDLGRLLGSVDCSNWLEPLCSQYYRSKTLFSHTYSHISRTCTQWTLKC